MKKIFILITMVGIFAAGGFAFAQTNPFAQNTPDPFTQNGVAQNQRCGPQGGGGYILCQDVGGLIQQRQRNFADFLSELYILAFILAGTVAFVRIVYGGVLYSWSGVVDRKKEAMGIFWNVAIGMALLMGSYVILNTINPALTILSMPNIEQSKGAKALPGNPKPLSEFQKAREGLEGVKALDRETQANLDLINDDIQSIGTPETPAQAKRLTELEAARDEALKYQQARKDQSEAAKMLFTP